MCIRDSHELRYFIQYLEDSLVKTRDAIKSSILMDTYSFMNKSLEKSENFSDPCSVTRIE